MRELPGGCINLEYPLPGGQKARLWDDGANYLGNQIEGAGNGRRYGLATDGAFLLVCSYGDGGADPQIVILKKPKQRKGEIGYE